jgi:glycosyltransferase involved in cell wall biosynthesis
MIDFAATTGGAERFAVGLAAHLPPSRFETWVCATRSSDPLAARMLDDAGVRHLTLGRTAKWDVHRLGGVAAVLRRHRFDVLHTHKFGSNLWGAVIGTACRVPVIVAHEHSWSYEGNPSRAWLDGQVIGRAATRFIAVSSADGRRMVSREGVDPAKVLVIPTAYIPSPASAGTDLRTELGLDDSVPLIAIAAVLRPEKRLDLLLEAHARVTASLPGARLAIAGDGPCRTGLERRAGELGIGDSVHFLGRRADVDGVLGAADVAALSSDREGLPLLVFECMANGLPIVATAVGGIPDVVQDGQTGILVPRRDPEALAGGLLELLGNPVRRQAMATQARAALHGYTIEAVAGRFGALYESLVGAARG